MHNIPKTPHDGVREGVQTLANSGQVELAGRFTFLLTEDKNFHSHTRLQVPALEAVLRIRSLFDPRIQDPE